MRILILDCETTVDNKGEDAVGDFEASPFSPVNHIVDYGVKRLGAGNEVVCVRPHHGLIANADFIPHECVPKNGLHLQSIMLVGHNIKFDLLHMMQACSTFAQDTFRDIKVWDTMLAEYLITGQVSQYASLDKCSVKYGGVLKDDRMKEYWKAGIKTQDIDPAELRDYMIQDVLNTELVFTKQMESIKKLGILPLVKSQMSGLKATVEMEYNGMHFNKVEATRLGVESHKVMAEVLEKVKLLLHGHKCYSPYFVEKIFNINSAQDLATALCGGSYTYSVKVDELDANGMPKRFKTGPKMGEIRQKKVVRTMHTGGFAVTPLPAWVTPSGKMGVGSSVLKDIQKSTMYSKRTRSSKTKEFCELVLEYRALNKDYKTYYVGYSDLTWRDSCIHQSLSHVGTDTGRLSCSKPNLQNATQTEDY